MDTPTAPECFVTDCDRLSALTDVSKGAIWTITAHYCSDCFTALLKGAHLEIDTSRLELAPAPVRGSLLAPYSEAQANEAWHSVAHR